MFTLKFYSFDSEDGLEKWDVVAAPHYVIEKKPGGLCTVITYSKDVAIDGVERIVGKDRHGYDACFIENSIGKTIDHLRAD